MLSDKRSLTLALVFCFVAIDLSAQDKLKRFYATTEFGEAKEVRTYLVLRNALFIRRFGSLDRRSLASAALRV